VDSFGTFIVQANQKAKPGAKAKPESLKHGGIGGKKIRGNGGILNEVPDKSKDVAFSEGIDPTKIAF
jgi:hypothetical protein